MQLIMAGESTNGGGGLTPRAQDATISPRSFSSHDSATASATASAAASAATARPASSKRKYKDLIKAALEERQVDLSRFRNELKVLEAQKEALVYDLDQSNLADNSDQTALIDADIKQCETDLSEHKQLLITLNATLHGSQPQARQGIVECSHQESHLRSSADEDSAIADLSVLADCPIEREPGSLRMPPPVPEDCPACHWARFMTAYNVQIQSQNTHISELQAHRASVEREHYEEIERLKNKKDELQRVECDIQKCQADVTKAENDVPQLSALCA